jgi:hypothetical protein
MTYYATFLLIVVGLIIIVMSTVTEREKGLGRARNVLLAGLAVVAVGIARFFW